MKIDLQTGDVVNTYFDNDNYDYVGIYGDEVVVGKEGVYYKDGDNGLEVIDYSVSNSVVSFYNNTSNYDLSLSSRYGSLLETKTSKKKISLFNYDSKNDIGVSFKKEIDRILVTNENEESVYVILDKFLDKRVYEVEDILYINDVGLNGEYTIYVKIGSKLYKTDYYVGV